MKTFTLNSRFLNNPIAMCSGIIGCICDVYCDQNLSYNGEKMKVFNRFVTCVCEYMKLSSKPIQTIFENYDPLEYADNCRYLHLIEECTTNLYQYIEEQITIFVKVDPALKDFNNLFQYVPDFDKTKINIEKIYETSEIYKLN